MQAEHVPHAPQPKMIILVKLAKAQEELPIVCLVETDIISTQLWKNVWHAQIQHVKFVQQIQIAFNVAQAHLLTNQHNLEL